MLAVLQLLRCTPILHRERERETERDVYKKKYIYMGALHLLGTPPAGLTKVSGLTQSANKHVNDEIGVHGLVQAVP